MHNPQASVRRSGCFALYTLGTLLGLSALPAGAVEPAPTDWPQFHGPQALGVAGGERVPPVTWDVEASQNVKWRIDVAGLGHSSPVVWGDKLFITTAVSSAQQVLRPGAYGDPKSADDEGTFRWQLLCFDKNSGRPIWEKTVHEGTPQAKRHPKASHANATVCTDGKHLIAFFGSEGLFCFDLDGNKIWEKSFGLLDAGAPNTPDYHWGFASSPTIYDGKVVVLVDVMQYQKKSFLAVFDAANGKEVWKTPRNDVSTWGTPTVWKDPSSEKTFVFANGYQEAAGYDFATGKKLWTLGNGGDVPVPTPIVSHGLIFMTSGHGSQSPVVAVKPSAQGDITPRPNQPLSDSIAWQVRQGGNYMQTPVVVGGHLFCCRDNGTLTCFEATTGKQFWRQRLEGLNFTASGVAAGDQLYFTAEDGRVQVVRAATKFELIASNSLGEPCLATPAISDGVLFFRTEKHLLAIGK